VNQHTARARTRVIDSHALLRLKYSHHQADHIPWSIKLSTLFARRICKLTDKILVGGANEIRKFKIRISQPVFIKMIDQVAKFYVRYLCFPGFPLKINMPEYTLKAPVFILKLA